MSQGLTVSGAVITIGQGHCNQMLALVYRSEDVPWHELSRPQADSTSNELAAKKTMLTLGLLGCSLCRTQ